VRRRTARAPTARVNDACELVAQNGMRVDFLDTFLLCSVGTQRKVFPLTALPVSRAAPGSCSRSLLPLQ
jgi:hypothetical protein